MDDVAAGLRTQRRRARGRVAALRRDLEDIQERSADAARDDEHDPEGATIAFERAQLRALLDDALRRLAEVETAQRRLAKGTHATCEPCGEPIARERLAAIPTARTCVRCAR